MIEGKQGRDRRIVTIFDDIYDLPDSSAYYRAMDRAGFRTAHHASAGFAAALDGLRRLRGLRAAGIVDFASGYGIAGALLRHRLMLDDVLARYRDPWFDNAPADAVIGADTRWYGAARDPACADRCAGIDIAGNALAYARAVGIFDAVFAENLQSAPPSPGLRRVMAGCDMIVECGSVAHMLPGALDNLLRAAPARKPWVVTAPIRGNDTAEAFGVMRAHGLTVQTMGAAPFRHRRFADAGEQARAIANARARGHDTDGHETEGFFHARLYLARPPDEAVPLDGWPLSDMPAPPAGAS